MSAPSGQHVTRDTATENVRDLSVSELVSRLSVQLSHLVREEVQLARFELERKARHTGGGAGLLSGAAVVALFGAAAMLAAAVLGLALVMPAWAAALVVGAALLVVAGVTGLIGRQQLKRGPSVPHEAVERAKHDVNAVRRKAQG